MAIFVGTEISTAFASKHSAIWRRLEKIQTNSEKFWEYFGETEKHYKKVYKTNFWNILIAICKISRKIFAEKIWNDFKKIVKKLIKKKFPYHFWKDRVNLRK